MIENPIEVPGVYFNHLSVTVQESAGLATVHVVRERGGFASATVRIADLLSALGYEEAETGLDWLKAELDGGREPGWGEPTEHDAPPEPWERLAIDLEGLAEEPPPGPKVGDRVVALPVTEAVESGWVNPGDTGTVVKVTDVLEFPVQVRWDRRGTSGAVKPDEIEVIQ